MMWRAEIGYICYCVDGRVRSACLSWRIAGCKLAIIGNICVRIAQVIRFERLIDSVMLTKTYPMPMNLVLPINGVLLEYHYC